MKTANAMKALGKYGDVKKNGGNGLYVHFNGWAVSFIDQMGSAICFSSRKLNCQDERDVTDCQYWDNLTQAIRYSFKRASY